MTSNGEDCVVEKPMWIVDLGASFDQAHLDADQARARAEADIFEGATSVADVETVINRLLAYPKSTKSLPCLVPDELVELGIPALQSLLNPKHVSPELVESFVAPVGVMGTIMQALIRAQRAEELEELTRVNARLRSQNRAFRIARSQSFHA